MSKSVLTVPQALGMSLLVYAGSSQLAVLPLLAAKLLMWTVLLTAAMANTRFIVFSAGLAPIFRTCQGRAVCWWAISTAT
ncbi:AzlC protein [Burkholderia sp. b13]|nr:AzlC protein [Burkholderia sp. b13]